MRGEILSISVVSRPSGDPYLTISQISMILPKFAKMVPSPRPYRSGLVVRPPAWDPRGARFDSWCMFKPRCFWVGAMVFPQEKWTFGRNGPIPQTVQIWPSGQASGLEPQGWQVRFLVCVQT